MGNYKRLILFAKNNSVLVFVCLLLNMVSGISKSVGAIYLQRITDALESNIIEGLVYLILFGGVLTFAAYILRWLGAIVPRYMMEKFSYETRVSLLDHLAKIPFLTYEGYPLGELQSLIQNDTVMAGQIFFILLSRILNNIFLFIFSIWVMAYTDLRATVVAVTIVLCATAINQLILSKMKKHEKAARHSLGKMTQSLESTFSAIETVKTHGIKEFVQANYLHNQQEFCVNKLKSAEVNAVRGLWFIFIENICLYGSVIYLGYMGIKGLLTIGEVLMFIYLIKQIIMPVEVIFRWMSTLVVSSASWERIVHKLDSEVEKTSAVNGSRTSQVDKVKIKNLSFAYDKSEPILTNLNLSFEKGKITGIFGSSGTGKTTLLKILSGLYYCPEAEYEINGKRIDSLKRHMTYATLEKSIFPMTIYENITLGDKQITRDDVKGMLFEQGFESWIATLPHGIDTLVVNGGISGGQKQAISTSRALLSHREMVILDEPFSALDVGKARCLMDKLKKEKEDRVIIITSHRGDMVGLFDREIIL